MPMQISGVCMPVFGRDLFPRPGGRSDALIPPPPRDACSSTEYTTTLVATPALRSRRLQCIAGLARLLLIEAILSASLPRLMNNHSPRQQQPRVEVSPKPTPAQRSLAPAAIRVALVLLTLHRLGNQEPILFSPRESFTVSLPPSLVSHPGCLECPAAASARHDFWSSPITRIFFAALASPQGGASLTYPVDNEQ
ncbi:hypothetical protein L227DRAFT_607255 [Lentinus tigrinus ALCF2SS1-6]|uniref:Uncharacterized protein n=1 Tax=Lentinus tigrinus ALCF2SS1-6 TaxID=1328759 RepID=A0A5C2SMS1_9APHY|nr:hypothetical protein L227DRAFT_607255 [Lentinus tigrinus ALCF2SS1-6]